MRTTEEAAALATALADQLAERRLITTPQWQRVFATVPRHVFVPGCAAMRNGADGSRFVLFTSPDPAWLQAVYQDETLVTQFGGQPAEQVLADTDQPRLRPTSSSTAPGLMAWMLEALDVHDGHRVLEVGTGTGYNAALLAERLGDANITSVDIDPRLVDTARARLADAGYQPTIATVDGAAGYPANAPYDRIIATCALPAIPAAWLEQTVDGGLILVNLHRDLGGGGMARLTVADGQASGRFMPRYGAFMPTRAYDIPDASVLFAGTDPDHEGQTRPAHVTAAALEDLAFGMLAALLIPGQRFWLTPQEGPPQNWILAPDGSWAYQSTDDDGRPTTRQGGPQRLWDQLERLHAEWNALGQPPRHQFGLTVTASGDHLLWHQTPGGRQWTLTTAG